ncbi:hypothetical protein HDU87_002025 [Geranomyces variabilis]|uniref:Steroid 5-alpha reductase C-terminal domain-containing protein n=1 Tax=Geranomyces variabilis TaxID=109894 RepID=A0AAD5XNL9_9FUNG|nr:hypothetical protein HDU87_002025 [Geranomyces variabilis]
MCLSTLVAYAGFTIGTHALALLTANSSWVDRAWSIAPVVYAATLRGPDVRSLIALACVTVWGSRLTYNFWRKDGFNIWTEDYRWAHLRQILPSWAHAPFHVLFITFYQNLLLLLLAMPFASIAQYPSPWTSADSLILAVYAALLLLQTIADQQQWAFHELKARAGPKIHTQFCTTGLFRYSRHPAFFAEMGMWWCIWAFSCSARGELVYDWMLAGPVLLTALFQGSTAFTEYISVFKYPDYKKYQKTTSRLIPLWPGPAIPQSEGID